MHLVLYKRPLRDGYLAQNIFNLICPKGPRHFSGSKYNLIRPKGPCGTLFQLKIQFDPPKGPCGTLSWLKISCGTTFCYSPSEIYDIGTEIIFVHCFATKMLFSFCKSICFGGIESSGRDLAFYNIKTWFKAFWDFSFQKCACDLAFTSTHVSWAFAPPEGD